MKVVYLNFSDLTEEAQDEVINVAIEEVQSDEGVKSLQKEADDMNIDYDHYLRERAERKLYELDYTFNV